MTTKNNYRIHISFGDDFLKEMNDLDKILEKQKWTRSRFFRVATRRYLDELEAMKCFATGVKTT